jgi:hypothetical protein
MQTMPSHTPSLLPNQYGWALATIIAAVAATAAVRGWWTARR